MKTPVTAADFLRAYSDDRLGSRETMRGAGPESFRELLDAMAGGGFRLPLGRGREEQVER